MTERGTLRFGGWVAAAALWFGGAGCSKPLDLIVNVVETCDQIPMGNVAHVEFQIRSAGSGQVEGRAVWSSGAPGGELDDIPLIDDAVITVLGLDAGESGEPDELLAFGSVGLVDLSGASGEPVVEVNVVLGKVGRFRRTTQVGDVIECSGLSGARRDHTATRLADGRVLVAGGVRPVPGEDRVTYWPTTEIYNPATGAFEVGPDLIWERRGHTATLLENGKVLIAGGLGLIDDDGDPVTPPVPQALQIASLFDPATGKIEERVQLLGQRAYHTATTLADGRVLLAGGTTGGVTLGTTEIFDPGSSSVSPGPRLGAPRVHHGAVLFGDLDVALVGGKNQDGTVAAVEFLRAGATDAVVGPDLQLSRVHTSALYLPDSRAIAVVGGFSLGVERPELGRGIANVEFIRLVGADLPSSTTVACPGVLLSEGRGAAMVMPAARGLTVVGGVGANGVAIGSAERITVADLSTCSVAVNPWPSGLGIPRARAEVVPLYGGEVLFVGGFGWDGNDVVSVGPGEIFVPETP